MDPRPSLCVAVQIERERQPNSWEDWRFRITQVLADDGRFGAGARTLRDDGRHAVFLHPGLEVALYPDEAAGYRLNLDSGAPAWFVMWRVADDDPSRAWPERVTLSYHEAGRLLDAQERVDSLPLPPELLPWLADFALAHDRPEPRRRRRPASFQAPGER
ncbi:MAG: DUF3305 domain-containing protein [Burkholderiales bacterium]|nr:DUF3305 domain-containing protein [Burkholderiales bacterium]